MNDRSRDDNQLYVNPEANSEEIEVSGRKYEFRRPPEPVFWLTGLRLSGCEKRLCYLLWITRNRPGSERNSGRIEPPHGQTRPVAGFGPRSRAKGRTSRRFLPWAG